MSTEKNPAKKDLKTPPPPPDQPPEPNGSEARPTGTAPVPHHHHVTGEEDDFGLDNHAALRAHLITDHPDEQTTARRASLSWAKLSGVHAALHEAVALPPEVTSAEDLAAQLAGQAHAELEDAPIPGLIPPLEPGEKAVFINEYPHHHGHSMSYNPHSGHYQNPWVTQWDAEPQPKVFDWEGTISGHFQATQVVPEDVALKSQAAEPGPEWTVQVLVSAVSVPLLAKAAVAEAVKVTGIKDGVVGNFKALPGFLVHPVGTGTTSVTAEAASKGHLVFADITVGFYPATAYPTAKKNVKPKPLIKSASPHPASYVLTPHAYESLRVSLLAAAKVLGIADAYILGLQQLAEKVAAEVIALDGTLDEALERMGFLAKLAGLPLAEKVTEVQDIVTQTGEELVKLSEGHTELPELTQTAKSVVVNPENGLAVVLPETQEEILAALVSAGHTELPEPPELVHPSQATNARLSPDDALDNLHAGGLTAYEAHELLKQARAKAQGLTDGEVPKGVVTAVVTVTFLPFYDAFRVAWHG